jgi:hypothetical protein
MKLFRLICLVGLILSRATAAEHELLTAVLQDHVTAGVVDYAAIAEDPRLDQYLAGLAATDPDQLPSREAQLALWINAYNAYTLQLVADAYPIESIHNLATGGMVIGWLIKRTPWDIRFAEVGGKVYTLNEIEHDIIRPQFQEPRIHFAIVCAAVSCPPLRSEAYEAATLYDQLNEQGRIFLNDPRHNRFDPEQRRVWLSKIFAWFAEDFGDDDEAVVRFVGPFMNPTVAEDIDAAAASWQLSHPKYDWSLNDSRAAD